LRQLVTTYGPQAVWIAGFNVLGFPPTWEADEFQVELLTDFLFQNFQSDDKEYQLCP